MHPDHTIQILVDENENRAYIQVQLTRRESFFMRVWIALKYVFGKQDWAYEDTVVDYSNARKMINALNKIKRDYKRKVEF